MKICGYVYKWDETFGSTDYKLRKDERLTDEVDRTQDVPIIVYSEFLDPNDSWYPVTAQMHRAIGFAKLRMDSVGIYGEVSLIPKTIHSKFIFKMTEQQIKDDLNIGLATISSPPVYWNGGFADVERICYVVLGRFFTPHIYKPDKVIMDKE